MLKRTSNIAGISGFAISARVFWIAPSKSFCAINLDSTGEQLAGEQPNLPSLLNDCYVSSTRLRCEFWLMHLPVETLEALHTGEVLGFRNLHQIRFPYLLSEWRLTYSLRHHKWWRLEQG